jgi:membrane fusion protein
MRTSLFRQEALEARRVSLVGSTLMARRFPFRLATGLSALAALALVALCFFGEYTRKVRVEGYLAPRTGLVKVLAGQAGTLVSKRIGEGQTVHRGDVLFVLSTERISTSTPQVQAAATAAIRARILGLERENEAQQRVTRMQLEGTRRRLQSMQSEGLQIQGMEVLQRQRVESAEAALGAYERLRTEGFMPSGQVDLKKNEVLDQQARLAELLRSRSVLERDMSLLQQELDSATLKEAAQRSRQESDREQLAQDAVESEARRELAITAPADGVATAVLGEAGQSTQPQSLLLTILPAGAALQAKLLVPSRAIGFLAIGDVVSLRYAAFPYQRFGAFKGRVVEIPRAMVTADEAQFPVAQREPVYSVNVALETEQVRTSRATVPLQSGMAFEADVWLDRRRLIEWFFEPVAGLAARV